VPTLEPPHPKLQKVGKTGRVALLHWGIRQEPLKLHQRWMGRFWAMSGAFSRKLPSSCPTRGKEKMGLS